MTVGISMAEVALPTLAFEVHGEISLIVLRQGREPASTPEWNAYMDAFAPVAHRLEEMRILVFTDGARPLPEQRAQASAVHQGRPVRTAVVSSSVAVSFAISVFALFNPGIRGFSPTQLDKALDYLGLTPDEAEQGQLISRRLARKMNLPTDPVARLAGPASDPTSSPRHHLD